VAGFEVLEALDPRSIGACRELFVEYQQGLGVSLCFQGFDAELAGLPGDYAPPRGKLLLATVAGRPAGCVALRPLADGSAELKRLYVRATHRGLGLGRALAERAIEAARAMACREIKLDTLPSMHAAQGLYARLGFVDIAPYNDHPIAGTRFLALALGPY
jgi:putative acetyltransferase